MITIAVLSDTHGLLRPEIPSAIKDVDHIIHAGDLGKMEILDELSGIAPTSIVRGNVDTGAWAASLPCDTVVDLAGHQLYILHDIAQLDLDPAPLGSPRLYTATPTNLKSTIKTTCCTSTREVLDPVVLNYR